MGNVSDNEKIAKACNMDKVTSDKCIYSVSAEKSKAKQAANLYKTLVKPYSSNLTCKDNLEYFTKK